MSLDRQSSEAFKEKLFVNPNFYNQRRWRILRVTNENNKGIYVNIGIFFCESILGWKIEEKRKDNGPLVAPW